MHFRSYSSEGFVLSQKRFSEADKLIVVYSKDYGKITLLAKGARKPTSKKRGHIEIFSLVRFSAYRSGIDILIEAQLINSFKLIKKSLKKVSLAYYICEVINKITKEGEENRQLYEVINTTFDKLSKTNSLKELRLEFIHNLLFVLGYLPYGKHIDVDGVLNDVLERNLYSVRVGKRVLV